MLKLYRTLVCVSILAANLSACIRPGGDESGARGSNAYQRISGDDLDGDRSQWDELFSKSAYVYGTEPAGVVKEYLDRLPRGKVLDIAMGEGRNAVYLARMGFAVDGVDYSEVAIRKAQKLAKSNQVNVNTINADLNQYVISEGTYSVILNIDYLQRSLIPGIKRGLKSGGVVIFENQTTEVLKFAKPLSIPKEYLLNPGELKEAFKEFKTIFYRESNDGKNAVATLVAQKP